MTNDIWTYLAKSKDMAEHAERSTGESIVAKFMSLAQYYLDMAAFAASLEKSLGSGAQDC
jgi:hypothetical protein